MASRTEKDQGEVEGRQMVRLGAITDEISDRLERSLALFSEWGLQDVEIHTLWGSSIERLEAGEVDRLKSLLDRNGLRTCMVSSTVFLRCRILDGPPPAAWDRRFDSIPGTYADHVGALCRCLETATALGAPLVRVFGFWPEEGMPASMGEKVSARLRDAADLAASHGIVLALENCPHTLLDQTRKVLEVLETVGSPWLRLLWDPSNAWRCGERDLVGLIDRAMPHLAHLHLKGIRLSGGPAAGRAYVPLDEGDVDYRQLLAGVLAAGYSGVCSLEPHYALPRTGREGAARESLARLRRLLDGLPQADLSAAASDVS
jgi:L-ribulose-5-phosphate 3-epimerase